MIPVFHSRGRHRPTWLGVLAEPIRGKARRTVVRGWRMALPLAIGACVAGCDPSLFDGNPLEKTLFETSFDECERATVALDQRTVEASGTVERWRCGSLVLGGGSQDGVALTADFDAGCGTVEFAGVTSAAQFQLQGLERRWDWCLADDYRFRCAFTIDTRGHGQYFNFAGAKSDERVSPSELFRCARGAP